MDSFQDQLLQIEGDFEAKFSALKSFTLSTLGEERKHNADFERRLNPLEEKMVDISMTDFGKFDDSFSTIREEIQELRDSRVGAAQEVNNCLNCYLNLITMSQIIAFFNWQVT